MHDFTGLNWANELIRTALAPALRLTADELASLD